MSDMRAINPRESLCMKKKKKTKKIKKELTVEFMNALVSVALLSALFLFFSPPVNSGAGGSSVNSTEFEIPRGNVE